jgi:predicted DNA-binding transcriptional regulator AlpA
MENGDSMDNSPNSLLHNPEAAAKLLNVSMSWLAKARLSGTGPVFVKLGRSVRYPDRAIREFVRARTRMSTREI